MITESMSPGDRFPGEVELASQYGVARITVRRAISDLVGEGLLVRHAGKGTFVSQPKIERELVNVSGFTARMQAKGLKTRAKVMETEIVRGEARLAEKLHVSLDDPILRIHRLRFGNDEPIAIEITHLSLTRFPGLDRFDFETQSLYGTLKDHYGIEPKIASQKTLEIRLADDAQASILQLAPGAPLFYLTATVLDQENVPLEYVTTYFRGDRFRFQI